jgi:hypothetical protein
MPAKSELQEWAENTPGAPLTAAGNVGAETIRAWNATHDRQYVHDKLDRVLAGIRPLTGIFEVVVDGQKVGEWRPEGGGFYGPSVLSEPTTSPLPGPEPATTSGTSALIYPG